MSSSSPTSAWSRYLELSARAHAAGQSVRERVGKERAAALAPKLSNLVIDVPPGSRVEGLEVRRDGTVVGAAEWGSPIPADAGEHDIQASAPDRKPWSQTVTLADGAVTQSITIPELEALPKPPNEPTRVAPASTATTPVAGSPAPRTSLMKIAAVAAGAVGVAGVGVGAAFGSMSMTKHNDAAAACPSPGPCGTQGGADLWRTAYNYGNGATVAFVVAGVGLAGGVALWFLAPKAAVRPAAQVGIGPGTLALKGSF